VNERETILVADDDADFAEYAGIVLEAAGYAVRTVHSGRECLLAVRQQKPSLILLDVMMESLVAGLQLGYELRSAPTLRNIPILMVSAISTETGFNIGAQEDNEFVCADEFLDKPVRPEVLVETVRRLLNDRRHKPPSDS